VSDVHRSSKNYNYKKIKITTYISALSVMFWDCSQIIIYPFDYFLLAHSSGTSRSFLNLFFFWIFFNLYHLVFASIGKFSFFEGVLIHSLIPVQINMVGVTIFSTGFVINSLVLRFLVSGILCSWLILRFLMWVIPW
jgi:hypothetical protein